VEDAIKAGKELPAHYYSYFGDVILLIEQSTSCGEESEKDNAFETELANIIVSALKVGDAVRQAVAVYPENNENSEAIEEHVYILFWDINESQTQHEHTNEGLNKITLNLNTSIHNAYRNKLMFFNEKSADDGNFVVAKEFWDIAGISAMICAFLSDYGLYAKMGCDVNIDGSLRITTITKILSGSAFAYAARLMGFYKEINAETWFTKENALPLKKPQGSIFVLSEMAYRAASENSKNADVLQEFVSLQGQYRPRINNSIKRDVYQKTYIKDDKVKQETIFDSIEEDETGITHS
ncbi:MAG: hypothetical protein WAW23_07010, partial [Candidatus Methanoperedens sp.]